MRIAEQNALEVTVAFLPDAALEGAGLGQLQVARKTAAETQANEAVRVLLRHRLRHAFLIITSLFTVAACLSAVNIAVNFSTIPPRVWQGVAFFSCPFVAFIGLTALLWSRRTLSLAQLRAVEMALVGLFALACVWKQFSYSDAVADLVRRYGDGGTTILAGYHGVFWFALLAIYGLFVPNSWRRCAVVVGLIAACPLALALARGGEGDWGVASRPFHYYLFTLGFWAAFGAVLAVFGSHHIEVLRQRASAVRELGQYRLTKRLGAGGMGEVYLAEHRLLRRPCAVKLIRPERLGDPRSRRRFEEEVQATAALTHPNTVEVYDYGHAEDGTFYYVMEYLPGLSLADLVSQHGPLPPGRAVFLVRQVCGALREAHALGLIHRDIKPGNIMACRRGGAPDVAKLLDFGLVQSRGEPSSGDGAIPDHGLVGTPAYLSPEQSVGGIHLDGRSDLYSLGAVAFFLLTGRPPFVCGTVREFLAAHRFAPAEFPAELADAVPADLQAVVLRCLAKAPADRFADSIALERALASCACAETWTREHADHWWQESAAR